MEPLAVDDLDEEDPARVDGPAEPGERGREVRLRRGRFARDAGRVGVDPPRDVECVETQPEVGPVHALDDLPGGFPGIDVRAPREGLVREPHGRMLLQPAVRELAQVGDDDVPVARRLVRGEEVRRDLDGVGAEDTCYLEPEGQFLAEEAVVLGSVEEALVEREGLEADDGEVEGVAQFADLVGGGEEGVSWGSRVGVGVYIYIGASRGG